MDGAQRIDLDMPILIPVSLSRGRFSQPDTRAEASFTRKQLDAVAPLSRFDSMSLLLNNPNEHTKEKTRRRIEAARNLKYPGNSNAE